MALSPRYRSKPFSPMAPPPDSEAVDAPPNSDLVAEPLKVQGAPGQTTEYNPETSAQDFVTTGVHDLTKNIGITSIGRRFLGTDVNDPLPMTRLSAQFIGGLGGMAIGSKVPGPPIAKIAGGVIGGAVGGVAGALAPEMTMQAAEDLGVLPKGTRHTYGLSDKDLNTVVKGEAVLDLMTGGGISALQMAGRKATRAIVGMTKAGTMLAEDAAATGINLLPVQVGTRQLPRSFVSVMGRFPMAAGALIPRARASQDALVKAFEELPSRIAPAAAMSEASLQVFTEYKNFSRSMSDIFSQRYEKLYQTAEQAGVQIDTRDTVNAGKDVLAEITKATPKGSEKVKPAPMMGNLEKFINDRIIPLERQLKSGNTAYSAQTLKQMDGLQELVDTKIASFLASKDPMGEYAARLLTRVQQAMQVDKVTHIRGAGANQVLRESQALDGEFSHIMQSTMETATAKTIDKAGREGKVADLAQVLLGGAHPEAVDDLARMTARQPELFKRTVASVLHNTIDGAFEVSKDGRVLNTTKLKDSLGIFNKTGDTYKSYSKMLEKAGGLNMQQVEKMFDAADAVKSVEIPNPSVYVQRRVVMTGMTGVLGAVGIYGAGRYGGGNWGIGTAATMALMIGGPRLLSAAISNPASARMLRSVINQTTSQTVKRAATMKAIRIAIDYNHDQDVRERGRLHEIAGLALEAADQALPPDSERVH